MNPAQILLNQSILVSAERRRYTSKWHVRTDQCHQQIRPCFYNKLYQKYNMWVKDYWNLFIYNLCLASFMTNPKCPFGAHAYPTAPNELISHPEVFNFVISLYSWDIFHLWGKLWVQTYLPFINCVFWKPGMILINRSASPFSVCSIYYHWESFVPESLPYNVFHHNFWTAQ